MNFDDIARLSFEEFDAIMRSSVVVDYDASADVLYVRRSDARTVNSNDAPNDGYLILSNDATGAIVAAKLMAASEMPVAFWPTHPDRELIPRDVIDAWVRANGRGAV